MQNETVGIAVKKLSNQYTRYMMNIKVKINEKVSGARDITGMQGWIIRYLFDRSGEDVFQKDIEKEFSIQRSTATQILQLMEKNDLITRETCHYDGRQKTVHLTPKAIEIHRKAHDAIADAERKVTKGISRENLKTFFEVIDKISRNIQ